MHTELYTLFFLGNVTIISVDLISSLYYSNNLIFIAIFCYPNNLFFITIVY